MMSMALQCWVLEWLWHSPARLECGVACVLFHLLVNSED